MLNAAVIYAHKNAFIQVPSFEQYRPGPTTDRARLKFAKEAPAFKEVNYQTANALAAYRPRGLPAPMLLALVLPLRPR